jgi:hypothetical protein
MKLHKVRFSTIRTEIKIAASIAFISILAIELICKNWPSPNEIFYRAGDIYLKVCYSIFASSVFYYINQHLPKDEKRVKTFSFVRDKVKRIQREVDLIVTALGMDIHGPRLESSSNVRNEIPLKDFLTACQRIHPKSSINTFEAIEVYPNWYVYSISKGKKINGLIKDLVVLNESLDSDLLENLLRIEEIVTRGIFEPTVPLENEDLTYWAHEFYWLYMNDRKCTKLFQEKYSKYRAEFYKRFEEASLEIYKDQIIH